MNANLEAIALGVKGKILGEAHSPNRMSGVGSRHSRVGAQGRKVAQRRSGHVTLLDIARACGFSVSTVSIVLSEAPLSQNVAVTTRKKIRAMAQQLGYHPDAFARSLRRRRSQTMRWPVLYQTQVLEWSWLLPTPRWSWPRLSAR